MNLNKIKIGQKLWSRKKSAYGEVVRVGQTGWITLQISGKLERVWHTDLQKRKPKEQEFTLFEELDIEKQRKVLKASSFCDLPIHTVMVELGYSRK
tara:strand:+ start:927 stop:1214 length:288 start_codon:yes stop_codon:yes gene_type:complete